MLFEAVAVVVMVVVWQLVEAWRKRLWDHGLFERMGVPYVKPHFIYGSNHIFRDRKKNQVEPLLKWEKEYGKLYGFFVAGSPRLVVSDLDMVKQILIKDSDAFIDRMKVIIDTAPLIHSLMGLTSQRWKEVRSALSTTFSAMKMKLSTSAMNEKVDKLISIFTELEKKGESFDCYCRYQALTLEVICACALALKSDCQNNVKSDTLLKQVTTFLGNAYSPGIALMLYFPWFRNILQYISSKFELTGRLTSDLVTHLKKVVAYRKKAGNDVKATDILQLMLDASATVEKGTTGRSKITLSDDEVVANAWMFLLAGFETTANGLSFTTFNLAKHPEIQERLYEEINRVVPEEETYVTYEQIAKLEYLEQVLSESLRLYPPVVTFVTRHAVRTVNVCGVEIPKGMSILIPVWNIHRNPEYWPEPEVYDPERFSEAAKAEERHPMTYIPFGAGPRNCIGMRFAKLEIKLAVIKIVRKFRIEVDPSAPAVPRLVTPAVGIKPSPGLPIRLVARHR